MTNLKLVSHTEGTDTAGAAVGEPAAVKTPVPLINEEPGGAAGPAGARRAGRPRGAGTHL